MPSKTFVNHFRALTRTGRSQWRSQDANQCRTTVAWSAGTFHCCTVHRTCLFVMFQTWSTADVLSACLSINMTTRKCWCVNSTIWCLHINNIRPLSTNRMQFLLCTNAWILTIWRFSFFDCDFVGFSIELNRSEEKERIHRRLNPKFKQRNRNRIVDMPS